MSVLPPGAPWLVGGVALMALEALLPGAFMVWLGLAAIGTGLATLVLSLSFAAEVVAFALLAAVAIAAGLRLRRNRRPNQLNTPGSGLVGRTAHALTVEGREGRVRIGDSDWAARLAAGEDWPAQPAPLEVVGIDGCTVVVRPRC
jgi:membrane protein implicated in regulation of membrane protease activity